MTLLVRTKLISPAADQSLGLCICIFSMFGFVYLVSSRSPCYSGFLA